MFTAHGEDKNNLTRSLRSLGKYFSTLEEKFRISKRPCNILIYYVNINEILNHFTKGIERLDFICNHSKSDLSRVKIIIQYNTYLIDRSPLGLFRANETINETTEHNNNNNC